MMQVLSWLNQRMTCAVKGHKMNNERVFYAPAKSIIPGYRCERCGKTQIMLYRWQTVGEKDD